MPKAAPPPRLFALDAGDVAPLQQAPLNLVVAVAVPQGERAMLGQELVWRTGVEVAYIAQTRWTARAQDLLQAAAVETLSRQGALRAAIRPGEARADYEVRWTVRSFEIVEENGAASAHFAANVLLIDTRDSKVIGVREIETEAPVASRSASLAAESLTRAAREGDARLGQFVVEALSSH